MSEEELREYCKEASLEISNMQHTIDKQKKVLDKIKEKVRYYRSAKYGTYDSDDILADLSYILLEDLDD